MCFAFRWKRMKERKNWIAYLAVAIFAHSLFSDFLNIPTMTCVCRKVGSSRWKTGRNRKWLFGSLAARWSFVVAQLITSIIYESASKILNASRAIYSPNFMHITTQSQSNHVAFTINRKATVLTPHILYLIYISMFISWEERELITINGVTNRRQKPWGSLIWTS